MSVLLETTLGDIVVDLYTSERKRSCINFLKLCKIKYYNYCLLFSVQRNYVAQTGDPSGTGRRGDSVYQKIYGDQARYFEMEMKPKIKHTKRGLISFVNNGNNQHGSQFFLTLADNLDYLDGKHTVFGEVSEGFDILDKINEAICDEDDRPYQDIRVNHTIILDDPFDDPAGLEIPDRSPEPTKEQLKSSRIGADEKIDEYDGKQLEEIQEIIEEKDLKIGTQILETIGDIPDAELKPPENVLFICKLNPVTGSEDLEIIFSRFGKTLSCEIIRDHKSGDSLCYGFIEFEKVEECEKAYFKMDNVLIDDRRIHVDFCQSINSQKWNKSGLRGKYAFGGTKGKDDASQQIGAKPRPKKFEMRNVPRRDKYEMVFDEEQDSSGAEENSRKPKKKDKQRKQEKSESDSNDDRTRKRKIDEAKERRPSNAREREISAEQRKAKKVRDEREKKIDRRGQLYSEKRDKRPDIHKKRYYSNGSEEDRYEHKRKDEYKRKGHDVSERREHERRDKYERRGHDVAERREHERKDQYERRGHDVAERREHDVAKRKEKDIELKRKHGTHKFETVDDNYDKHSKHKSKKAKKEKKKRKKSDSSSSSS